MESALYGVIFTRCLCQKPSLARTSLVRVFDTNNSRIKPRTPHLLWRKLYVLSHRYDSYHKATLEYQQYTDKNTFIPKEAHPNQSCDRSHHNWHCNQSDLFAAQFSSILWWCWVICMKETHMPSSYKWVSYQGFVKTKGKHENKPSPSTKTSMYYINLSYHKNLKGWISLNSHLFQEHRHHVTISIPEFP